MIFAFLLTICALMLGTGFLALRFNYRSLTNRFFFLFVFFFDFWLISNYFSNSVTDYSQAVLFNKLIFFSTIFLGLFLSFFITVYPNAKAKFNKIVVFWASTISVFIAVLSLTDLIVQSVVIKEGVSEIIFGDGITLYAILLLSFLIYSIVTLIRKFRASKGIERLKIQYLMLGITLTTLGVIATNLILPIIFSNFDLSNIGAGFSLILVGLSGYSIIKHRLLGVKVLLGSLLSIILISVFTFIVFYSVLLLENRYMKSPLSPDAIGLNLFIALLFSVLFLWIYKYITGFIRRTYIHSDYDPVVELDKFNASISKKLKLSDVTQEIQTKLKEILKVDRVILLKKKEETHFEILNDGKDINTIHLQTTKDFFLSFTYQTVIKDELESLIFSGKATETQHALYKWIEMNKFSALVSLVDEKNFQGFIAIGKRSIPYDNIDTSFLVSISRSSNVALGRAFLYAEVEEFNQTLQKKVDDATEEIKDKNKKLQDTLNFERDMLDILGHELRTPLGTARNALLTMQKLSKDNNLDPANLNKLLGMSIDHIRREVQLLETILASTKVDNAKLDLAISKVDAKKIAQTTYEIYNSDAEKKDLKLIITLPDNDIYCMADPLRLQQVIDNIVSNAVKYTFKGQIEISLETDSYFVKFVVKDTGEGIPASDIPNLGKKFFRVNTYLKSEGKLSDNRKIVRPGGTGIGLYVVFELTKAMKGRVEVKSKLGEGSTFTVFIPKAK